MAYPYITTFEKNLTTDEMKQNATYFKGVMQSRGWSINAIAAAFGNWQSECRLNTNNPEKSGYPSYHGGGFGLPQWTPWYRKYGRWCEENNIQNIANDNNPAADINKQLDYHDYECKYGDVHNPDKPGGATWYSYQRGDIRYSYSWDGFKRATDDVAYMARAYYWQYERSNGGTDESADRRAKQAVEWYKYLTGSSPDPPTPPPDPPTPPTDTNYLEIVFYNLEVLKINGGNYKTIWGEKKDLPGGGYVYERFYYPRLQFYARAGDHVEIEVIPTEFYFIYWQYRQSTIETITGPVTVTEKYGTETYIGKYLKTTKPYIVQWYGNYDATISTKNYATYNSAVISGVVDNRPINDATKIGGYYSGSNSGLTLTDYPAFFEIDVLNRLKRKSKAYIYALRRRYPIYG